MKEKVIIGIPSGGSITAPLFQSITKLMQWENKNPNERYELIDVINRNSLYIQENRNNLVKDAKQLGADWLLQLDSDNGFEPTFLRTIMRNADKDIRPIIFGLYSNLGNIGKDGSFEVLDCVYREVACGGYQPISVKDDGQMLEVDGAGTGLFLSHLSIYDKIPYPWFWVMLFQENGKTPQMMNEDLAFCRTARNHGYHLWCTLWPKHIITNLFLCYHLQ
jgi:hypothetical protein